MALQPRPPVITIMGHVDHGKTSLLDAIRSAKVAAGEAGGITQHIGAYQVEHNGRAITFIDTPGHAAFSAMRSRGAKATDIVVLVVAADDGVKPQTVESIEHIKAAGVEYIVAINKIDLPDANPIRVKTELAEHEVFVEGFGGNVSVVEVSAKTKQGIDELLEMLLLMADVKGLQADPDAPIQGVVIESGKDSHTGPYATLLIQNGTLKIRQTAYTTTGEFKVRTMQDEYGKRIDEAGPSRPVLVTGFSNSPEVGSIVAATISDHEVAVRDSLHVSAPQEGAVMQVILKADVGGSMEAIIAALPKEVQVMASSIGEPNESDVILAETTKSRILAFNVKTPKSVDELAKTHSVKIRSYKIIYELLENIEDQVEAILNPTLNEEELGSAEITAQFEIRGDRIAGCKVVGGEIKRGQNIFYHLKRNGEVIADPRIKSLKQAKQDVEVVKAPSECGIVMRSDVPFAIGDTLTCFVKKDI